MVPILVIVEPSQPELGLGQTMEYNWARGLLSDGDNDVAMLHNDEFRCGWFREG